jgi:peptidoglycan hydrolase-like protein with peptidoglycan-binding domain
MIRTRRLTLLIIAAVAVVALAVGMGAGQFIRSPADAASRAQAPEASAITVPVELRVLESEVRTRGDVAFAGSADIELDLGGLETAAVITGHVPERGDELAEGEPLIEVVGRPVIALEGELPMYRSLGPGMSGPDVVQLKQTLRRIGLDPGSDDDDYTWATAQAVAELYGRAGYLPPEPDEGLVAERDAANDAVVAAEEELSAAKAAASALADTAEPGSPELAEARTRVEQAEDALDDARGARSEAQFRAATPLPSSEVYYLPNLPRHVADVSVSRGDVADGKVMSVSGTNLQVTTQELDDDERALMAEGMDAILELPGGEQVGTVAEVESTAVIDPPDLSGDEIDAVLENPNILVVIPVSSTEGEVLAVPESALTAGPGGESRVEVQREDGQTELVEVTIGLVAQGYAEVSAVDGVLAEGDLVVVGESALDGEADSEADEE